MFANETLHEAEQWRRVMSFVQRVRHLVLRLLFFSFGDLVVLPGQLRHLIEESRARPIAAVRTARAWLLRSITYFPNILVLVWIYNLYRGEYSVFNAAVDSCDWSSTLR